MCVVCVRVCVCVCVHACMCVGIRTYILEEPYSIYRVGHNNCVLLQILISSLMLTCSLLVHGMLNLRWVGLYCDCSDWLNCFCIM